MGGLTVDAVRQRLEMLDRLETDGLEADRFETRSIADARAPQAEQASADAERARLEAELEEVYDGIREEVRAGRPDALRKCLESEGSAAPQLRPGLSYDWRDELVSGVLALKEPEGVKAVGAEMVFYQPTPVRHLMELIARARITEQDVLVDLGSGLGHVPLLVGMLTGAECRGIEIDGAYVACARECAERLGLSGRVTFAEGDARRADLSGGTVFYLYTPFTGGILRAVLDRMRDEVLNRMRNEAVPKSAAKRKSEAGRRAIRVCTLGPCAEVVARERWLTTSGPVETERVTVFDLQQDRD